MYLRSCLALGAALALAACATPPVNRDESIPLTTAAAVDLDRYLGRWYEIARYDSGFEKDCEGVTADYSRRPDGLIAVLNSCRVGAADGKLKTAEGKARIVDTATNAKLKVSFFGPFWGDYWVLWRADDYSVALVGEPSGRYLWILARDPAIGEAAKNDALERLRALGYDTADLYFPIQPPQPDNPRPE